MVSQFKQVRLHSLIKVVIDLLVLYEYGLLVRHNSEPRSIERSIDYYSLFVR
jgi:hypothetical protein